MKITAGASPNIDHAPTSTTAVGIHAAHREHRARIAMVHVMQPRHERAMRMRQHAVDDVLGQRPRKQSGREYKRIEQHRL